MRIYFDSMAHPKRLSKRLSAETGRALHLSQTAVARMFGHSDWHALEASVDDAHLHKISLPDRLCAPNVVESRYVFQCHVLQREFDLGLAETAEIVVKLEPTNSFRTKGERESAQLAEMIFPTSWTFVKREGIVSAETDSLTIEVSTHKDAESTFHGTRHMVVRDSTQDNPEIWTSLDFSVSPSIDQDVIVGINLTLLELEGIEENDDLEMTAEALLAYLNSPALNAFGSQRVSGAADGIVVRLHGELDTPELCDFADVLVENLEVHSDAFQEAGDVSDDIEQYNNEIRIFPVRSVDDSTSRAFDDAADDEVEDASEREQFEAFLEDIPKLLAHYLRSHSRGDLAEFASALSIDNVPDTQTFGRFVGGLHRAGAIPDCLARMLMMFAVRRVSELDGTGDFWNRRDPDRDQKIAETFNDSRFSEFLANSDFADHDRMLREGLALLLGVDPEQLVGQESSSTGEVDVLSLLELASEAAALTRQLSPDASDEDNDDRLFPLTKDEMHEHLATFLRNATGEDVDVEAFIRQMRVNGGIHGVPRVDWYNLLHFLGWDLTEFNESGPKRFTPAFWASTRDGDIELPVIVEGYMYSPGDEEDELAQEAFLTLPKRYPKGCILVFGSMLYKVVDKRCYTFGGMLFRNGQWRPFALSQSVVSLDDLLLQHEKVFSFDTPGRDYEDVDGKLARTFNAMAAGWDVETDPQPPMMSLDLHGWVCPMLRTITLPKSR